jgi:kynurenine formamidase
MLIIDEHTGTQWDAPAHFVPPPGSGYMGEGPMGLITGEKVPAWQFCGEACVVDVTAYRDKAALGQSYLIGPEIVVEWEKNNRRIGPGDVVLFRSDYTDKYYKPFPAGDRFVSKTLKKEAPAWPAPTPETMEFLAKRGVTTLGLDGASMGPLPDLAVATHQAGGKRGMIWVECATNLKSLPVTGAFFAIMASKHVGGSGGECRCIAVTDTTLAKELIAMARAKNVSDLSVPLQEDLPIVWPGRAPGEEGGRYISKVLNAFSRTRGPFFALTHMFDSFAGTHVVLPSFSLPESPYRLEDCDKNVSASIAKYEKTYGKLGCSNLKTESTPLDSMMGQAHLIDVRSLCSDTIFNSDRQVSPIITRDFLEKHAKINPFKRGEVVLIYSGYTDTKLKPIPDAPEVDELYLKPLNGKSKGWAALSPEALSYLAEAGIRCVGTDGPTLGGVIDEYSLFVDWKAASLGLVIVEFLTNLKSIEGKEAYFIFSPIKIEGTRGGYGRALALYK